jgi:delta-aminolevulinic acid dehydratase/porphobilinogen synthase
MSDSLNQPIRLRRLRASAGIRAMLSETVVEPRHLIQPLFVTEGEQAEPCLLYTSDAADDIL